VLVTGLERASHTIGIAGRRRNGCKQKGEKYYQGGYSLARLGAWMHIAANSWLGSFHFCKENGVRRRAIEELPERRRRFRPPEPDH